MKKLNFFLIDENGATAVEYGVMIAAIAGIIIGIVMAIGITTQDGFNALNTGLDKVN